MLNEAKFEEGSSARSFEMSQSRINCFAECTEDRQWIHVDPVRAATESPTGGTIAHGYLTLSLLAEAHEAAGVFPSNATRILNYGLDKVRFLAPVPVGAKLSFQIDLLAEEARKESLLLRTRATGFVEGVQKPVILAEALYLVEATNEAKVMKQ